MLRCTAIVATAEGMSLYAERTGVTGSALAAIFCCAAMEIRRNLIRKWALRLFFIQRLSREVRATRFVTAKKY
jgi:hypothetical protein